MRTQAPPKSLPSKKELLEKLARTRPNELLGVLAYWVGDKQTSEKR